MNANWNAFVMLVRAELTRCCRIWMQYFIPPVITLTLYFLIFGKVLGGGGLVFMVSVIFNI